jgi:hypothetical protein
MSLLNKEELRRQIRGGKPIDIEAYWMSLKIY